VCKPETGHMIEHNLLLYLLESLNNTNCEYGAYQNWGRLVHNHKADVARSAYIMALDIL
jgi:hypothetical protein